MSRFFPDPKQTCSYWLVKPPFLASLRNQQRGLEVGELEEEGGTMDAGTTGGVEMERLDFISSIIFIFNTYLMDEMELSTIPS